MPPSSVILSGVFMYSTIQVRNCTVATFRFRSTSLEMAQISKTCSRNVPSGFECLVHVRCHRPSSFWALRLRRLLRRACVSIILHPSRRSSSRAEKEGGDKTVRSVWESFQIPFDQHQNLFFPCAQTCPSITSLPSVIQTRAVKPNGPHSRCLAPS